MIGFFVSVSVIVPFLFLFFYLSSKIIYTKKYKENYSIKNHFIFEFNDDGYKENIIGNIFLILATILFIPLLIFYYRFSKNGYFLFSSISMILILIFINLLSFVPLRKLKEHLLFSSFVFSLTFLSFLSLSIGLYKTYEFYEQIIFLILGIIIFVVSLFHLFINIWISFHKFEKMIDKENEYGTIIKIRNKFILLAFFEWINSFVIYFSPFIFALIYILLK